MLLSLRADCICRLYNIAMQDSIFTKIVKGEIPCNKVYEDDKILAFLDINPKTDGHTLIIPKKQVEFIWDLDEETYLALMMVVKKVGVRIREVMDMPYVGQAVLGIEVPHVHVHVFPFSTLEEYNRQPDKLIKPDFQGLNEVAKKLEFK